MALNRTQRRWIRGVVAVLSAIGAGSLTFPDFVPTLWAHGFQQADAWIAGVFLIINPFLDIGSTDAPPDKPAE